MIIVQSVLNRLKNINPKIRTYILGLILASGRKNCAAMAYSTGLPKKELYAFLSDAKSHTQEIEDQLLLLAKETKKENVLRVLIVDPTTLIKSYAKKMQRVCYDRSGCTKNIERCLVPVYVAVADQNITIPLGLDFWVQEKIAGKRQYKSKAKITRELIDHVSKKGIGFDAVSLDGAYAVPEIFKFFQEKNELHFIMRIPKNRNIILPDGRRSPLKVCLRLNRNERAKTIKATLYSKTYFFTAYKRKKRECNDWETVYVVSNMDLPAKQQAAAYDLRWPVEKMNRTTKQKFGTAQCQTTQALKQRAHIMAAFLAYSILGLLKIDYQSQSVDELVNLIRASHFDDLIDSVKKTKKNYDYSKRDPILKSIQKMAHVLVKNHDAIMHLTH